MKKKGSWAVHSAFNVVSLIDSIESLRSNKVVDNGVIRGVGGARYLLK